LPQCLAHKQRAVEPQVGKPLAGFGNGLCLDIEIAEVVEYFARFSKGRQMVSFRRAFLNAKLPFGDLANLLERAERIKKIKQTGIGRTKLAL
jgi:hypothetical protein